MKHHGSVPTLLMALSVFLLGMPAPILAGEEVRLSPLPNPDAGERYRPQVAWNSQHREYLTVWHNTWPGGERDVYARRVDHRGQLRSWFAVTVGATDRFQPDVAYNPADNQYLVVWTLDVAGDGSRYEIWGKIILWNAPGTNTEFVIGNVVGKSSSNPHVVWDSHMSQYMVCWDEVGEASDVAESIGCRAVHRSGVPLSYSTVTNVDMPHQSDLTFIPGSAGRYVVVWRGLGSQPGAPQWDIYGQIIDWSVFPIGSRVPITDPYPNIVDTRNPTVACDNAELPQARCHVLWEDLGSSNWDIAGREFAAFDLSATSPAYLLLWPIPINHNNTAPEIVYSGTRDYFVIFYQQTEGAPGNLYETIRGLRWRELSYVGHSFVVQDAVFWNHEEPAAAAGDDDVFVVYAGDDGFTRHIYGRTALTIFWGDFEIGNTSRWSATAP